MNNISDKIPFAIIEKIRLQMIIVFLIFLFSKSEATVTGFSTDTWGWPVNNTFNNGFRLINRVKDIWNTNANVSNEAFYITGNGRLWANWNANLTISNSIIKANNPRDYFLRIDDDKTITVTNSSSLIVDLNNNRNIEITNLTNKSVINAVGSGNLYVRMPGGARVTNSRLEGINSIRAEGTFSAFHNVDLVNTKIGMFNYDAGRIDRYGINIPSTTSGWLSRLGNGNGGNNSFWDWNPTTIDDTKIIHQHNNSKYYKGYTASYRFVDVFDETNVEDVVVIYRDDRNNIGGVKQEVARFITNSNGLLRGRINTRNLSNGANIERPVLYFLTKQSRRSGGNTIINIDGTNVTHRNYVIDNVSSELEVKSYLHQFNSASYSITGEVGKIDENGDVIDYINYYLKKDDNITNTNITAVLNYTELETTEKLYDRAKAEWRNNDSYPLFTASGGILRLSDGWSINVDNTIATAYEVDIPTKTVTIKTDILAETSKFNRLICDGGEIKFINNENIDFPYSDINRDSYVRIINVDPTDVITVTDDSDVVLFDGYSGEFGYAYNSGAGNHKIILKKVNDVEAMKLYPLSNTGIENKFSISFVATHDDFTVDDRKVLYSAVGATVDSLEHDKRKLQRIRHLLMLVTKKIQNKD